MKILSIDLGKHKSVACRYDTAAAPAAHASFETVATTPQAFHDLIAKEKAKSENLPAPDGTAGPAARRRRRPQEEAAE